MVDSGWGVAECTHREQSSLVTVDAEAARYQATLEQMAHLGEGASPISWNRLVDKNHESYLVLRETDSGRAAVERLMRHTSSTVRCWAAAHALLWNEEAARPVLEALAAEGGPVAVGAKYTLIEFDRGRLSHDW